MITGRRINLHSRIRNFSTKKILYEPTIGTFSRRWYSPVRSHTPIPPRARRIKSPRSPLLPDLNANSISQIGTMSSVLRNLLSEPVLVFERHLEFMNVVLGFEQANRYTIYKPSGEVIGSMEEDDLSITRAIMRQVYRLHRPFTVNVYDVNGALAMTIRRPFSLINSHIKCIIGDYKDENNHKVIGESKQEWHLWRRRYNLYKNNSQEHTMEQFGRVDAPFLAFSFPVEDEEKRLIGAIDRNWVGLAREVFTDTGVYVVRNTSNALQGFGDTSGRQLVLQERAVMLATAVSIDFDYFSRHSSRGTMVADDV